MKDPLQLPAIRRRVVALRDAVVARGDDAYSPLLAEIVDPPPALFFEGDRSLLHSPSVAIVGSRDATRYGIDAARRFASDLARLGVTVVSGLAHGIDSAAHAATIEAGGATIAVLGAGLDTPYPRGNAHLRTSIETSGLVVTEFPPGTPPHRANFPVRNRVISGLCAGTIVVEATGRSGSLITARLAAEQGREVFAVPGPVFSSRSEGPHRLIQYGAKLVHDVGDVLDELPSLVPDRPASPTPEPPPDDLAEVWAALDDADPTHVDALAARVARPPGELAEALLRLEIGGWVRALPGGSYVRSGG